MIYFCFMLAFAVNTDECDVFAGRSVAGIPAFNPNSSSDRANAAMVQPLSSADATIYSTNDRVYLSECGAVGKQTISVDGCDVTVTFRTGRSAIGQRGFLLKLEGNDAHKQLQE